MNKKIHEIVLLFLKVKHTHTELIYKYQKTFQFSLQYHQLLAIYKKDTNLNHLGHAFTYLINSKLITLFVIMYVYSLVCSFKTWWYVNSLAGKYHW